MIKVEFKAMFLFVALIFSSAINAQEGIEFFHGTMEEAKVLAKQEGKLIFVDAFATWCGPCKRMAATTFKDEKVGDFFNKQFINMKIDMERAEGIEFRRTNVVTAFPTLFVLDAKGELVQKAVGGKNVNQILEFANTAISKVDYAKDYAQAYEKGNREPELIYNYVKGLNKSRKSSLKVANEYLRTQKDLTTDFNLRFLLEATTEADSRIFDLMIENKDAIIKLCGDQVTNKILRACTATAEKAAKYEDEDLLKFAQSTIKKHIKKQYKAFKATSEADYYATMKDEEHFLKAVKDYLKIEKDADILVSKAKQINALFPESKAAKKVVLSYYKKASKNTDNYKVLFGYAVVLNNFDQNSNAIEIAQKAKKMALKKDQPVGPIDTLIKKLKEGI